MIEAGLGDIAAQFHALGAQLAAALAAETSGRVAVEILPDILGGVRQGELATIRAIERADRSCEYASDGAASTCAFVRGVSGESPAWASKRVNLGRALADRMPVTGKTWSAGDLGLDHAQVIAATVRDLPHDLALAIEGFLAEQAARLTVTELKIVAAEVLAAAAPEQSDKDAASKRAAQRLCLSQTLDGMWRLDGWLDAEAGLIVAAAIASFTRKPDPEGDPRTETAPSRRAEALVQMARHASAHAETCHGEGGSRHTIIVGLSHQALLDGL
ncbi:MAG TPA: DUF222 domain-containing protein, partial [Frankiaceae bacterium]|nr:DUF222 domain-containing protein [Frankiaceae bacterium]